MLAKCRRQTGARFDIRSNVGQQTCEPRVRAAPRDDVERLNQRHTGTHHGRKLARENGDVFLLDGLAAAHAALFHLGDQDALATQAGAHHGLTAGAHFTANELAVLVFALVLEDDFFDVFRGCGRHGASEDVLPAMVIGRSVELFEGHHSFVHEMISSSVVTPERTLTKPDCRKSRTPSRCACLAMSTAVPSAKMMRWISSVIGITW